MMKETHEEQVEQLRVLRQKAAEMIQSEVPEERARQLQVPRQNTAARIEFEVLRTTKSSGTKFCCLD